MLGALVVELLFILITTCSNKLSRIEGWTGVVTVMHHIASLKPNSTHISISNKTIFKHMDMLDTICV